MRSHTGVVLTFHTGLRSPCTLGLYSANISHLPSCHQCKGTHCRTRYPYKAWSGQLLRRVHGGHYLIVASWINKVLLQVFSFAHYKYSATGSCIVNQVFCRVTANQLQPTKRAAHTLRQLRRRKNNRGKGCVLRDPHGECLDGFF